MVLPLVALALLAPMFTARLGAIDDHEIISLQRLLGQGGPLAAFAQTDQTSGRFRPLYWIAYIGEIALWGQNVAGWYLDRLLLLLGTLASGYALARLWMRSWVAALVAIGIVLGPQAEAWYRLGPQEAFAMPLALAGLALLGRRKFGFGLALACLAALVKEPFVVTPIVGMVAAWRLGARQSVIAAGVITTITGLGIVVALVTHGGDQYGAIHGTAVPLAGRYLLPWLVVPVLGVGWLLNRHRWLVAPTAVFLGMAMVVTVQSAATWRAETIRFASLIDTLRADPRPLMVVAPTGYEEPLVALGKYLPGRTITARTGSECLIVDLQTYLVSECP